MAELYSQYISGAQLDAGIIAGSSLGVSGLNPIVDRLNSIAPAGSQISGTQLSIYGNFAGLTAGNGIDINNGSEIAGETASITNAGVIECATSAEMYTGTDATRAATPDSTFDVLPPVGAVVAWLKTIAGIPGTLPAAWVECDGSVISDAESPIDGETLPNLNGNNHFLRGNSTSGGSGGGTTADLEHSHTIDSHTHTWSDTSSSDSHSHTVSGTTSAGSAHTHSITGEIAGHAITSAEMASHSHGISGVVALVSPPLEGAAGANKFVWSDRQTNPNTGNTGGNAAHTHTDTLANASESTHTHTWSDTSSSDAHTHSVSGTTAGGTGGTSNALSSTQSILPPYYNVVWIIRIK